jgi:hypothetical protein
VGLFDGYFDSDQFGQGGGLLGRLLALQQQAQPAPNSVQAQLVAPAPAPVSTPVLANYGPTPSTQSVGRQESGNQSLSGSATNAIGSALSDFYRQTILQAGKDIAGYATDAVHDPIAFARAMGPSLATLGPIASELPAVVKGAMGATGTLRRAAQPNVGDLTTDEIQQIQSVVNEAGRPLEVVGSAARGNRTPASDIDYLVPPSSMRYYDGLQGKLPGVDPKHGMIPGVGNANIGPVIRFEPK